VVETPRERDIQIARPSIKDLKQEYTWFVEEIVRRWVQMAQNR
jgi:hypothetical protein